MLLTKECDYAIRIVRALSSGEKRPVVDISAEEDISMNYIYKLARKLEKAGIIETHRGVNGGYSLKKSLESISLFDVFLAVDQTFLVSDCTDCDYHCSLNTPKRPCLVHKKFCELQKTIEKELKSTTLKELVP